MKKFFLILLVLCLSLSLFACESGSDPDSDYSPFVEIVTDFGYKIVYSSINGVIYYADVSYTLSGSDYSIDALCPLYNPDGSLMVYPDDWNLTNANS